MARFLLVLFAVLTAGIAYAVEPWLYLAAVALLLGAIGLLVRDWRRDRRRRERRSARAEAAAQSAAAAADDDDLHSLGIMEIRPRGAQAEQQEEEGVSLEPPEPAPEGAPEPSEASPPTSEDAASELEVEEADPEEMEQKGAPAPAQQPRPIIKKRESHSEKHELAGGERPAGAATPRATNTETLNALLRAARLAVGAPAAVLLVQEETGLTYRIEALDAAEDAPPLRALGTSFSTDDALLSASAARRPVTRQPMGTAGGEWAPRRLGYYRRPTEIDEARLPAEVMLAPLPTDYENVAEAAASPPAAHFLLVEIPKEEVSAGDASTDRKKALLEHFAGLLAQVAAPTTGTFARGRPARGATAAQIASTGDGAASGARPRREIVAEEMNEARREERDLALALVYLNRAEAIAGRGEEELHAAERALRTRLRRAAPDGRVEPFGELTYGVFYSGSRKEMEAWALTLQDELAEAEDPLEGGVSVGLALMRGPQQDPTALRRNATNALREAYTTGTCTILD